MRAQKKLQTAAARRGARGRDVEIWAMDEHRIGLKPIVRGVWAPVGERRSHLASRRVALCDRSSSGDRQTVERRNASQGDVELTREQGRRGATNARAKRQAGWRRELACRWHPPRFPAATARATAGEHLWAFVDEPLATAACDHREPDQRSATAASPRQQQTRSATTRSSTGGVASKEGR